MTKTEIVKAVTKWFDVDKYDVLNELTVEQIYIEVERRVLAYNLLTQYDSLKPQLKALVDDHEQKIQSGKVLFNEDAKIDKPEEILSSSYIANPLTIAGAKDVIGAVDLVNRLIGPEEEAKRSRQLSQYLSQAGISKDVMFVEIHLSEASTEDIIEHLKTMIPRWKKELKVKPHEERGYRFGVGTIKKVMKYNLIPMFDLMFWEKKNNTKIGIALLTRLLYPHLISEDNRSEGMVKDTDYPLAVGFMTNQSYIKSLGDFIVKYDSDRDWKVWRFINYYLPEDEQEEQEK